MGDKELLHRLHGCRRALHSFGVSEENCYIGLIVVNVAEKVGLCLALCVGCGEPYAPFGCTKAQ